MAVPPAEVVRQQRKISRPDSLALWRARAPDEGIGEGAGRRRPRARASKQAREPGEVIVGKELCDILIQEPRRRENFEPLVAIELQNVANAVEDLATDPAVTRFESTERTAVDLRQAGDLLLGQPS